MPPCPKCNATRWAGQPHVCKDAVHNSVDNVNHPPHYTSHPSGVECITVVEHLSYNLGNAIAYLWRAPHKGNLQEDLDKAIWYIKREKTRLSTPDADALNDD
jgi:hypothetical protein